MLLPMTIETATYGLTAGLFRKRALNVYLSTLLAMLAGRLVYTLVFLLLGRVSGPVVLFWQKAFMPGLVSALIMLAGLPIAASGISYLLKDKE